MPPIKFQTFRGILPIQDPRALPMEYAQKAENCDLISSSLKPIRNHTRIQDILVGTRTIYPYYDVTEPTVDKWLSWTTDVNIVRNHIAADQYHRIYYTGDGGKPKIRYVLAGVEVEADLGVTAPATAPTITLSDKTAVDMDWNIKQWHYHWEEPNGAQIVKGSDYGIIQNQTTGIAIDVVNKSYYIDITTTHVPTAADLRTLGIDVSASAKLVIWCEIQRGTGANAVLLGRVFPAVSMYSSTNDAYVDGCLVKAAQDAAGNSFPGVPAYPEDPHTGYGHNCLKFTLSFDSTNSSDYTTDRAYVYTLVSALGEESPPSPASAIIPVAPTKKVVISGLPSAGIKRIYRTVTVSTTTNYQFVAEIAALTTSYTDILSDGQTQEKLPSLEWEAPPTDLEGIVFLPCGSIAGFSGRTIYFSEPYQPHAWPTSTALTVDYDIVGLGVYEGTLVVCTEGYPYIIYGTAPGSMTVTRLALAQACSCKHSICSLGGNVVYASPDGIVSVHGSEMSIITGSFMNASQWQAYEPSTMIIKAHDTNLYVFSTKGTLVFQFSSIRNAFNIQNFEAGMPMPQAQTMSTASDVISAAYEDIQNDALYVVIDHVLYTWGTHATFNKTLTWKSKAIAIDRPVSFVCARVVADDYPMTLNFYANDIPVLSCNVVDNTAFKIPVTRSEKLWAFEIIGDKNVHEINIGNSIRDL